MGSGNGALSSLRRYSPFRHLGSIAYKGRPIHLTVFLTRRCNQRCAFCFYLAAESDRAPGGTTELTLDELHRLADSSPSLLWLAFSGGEIFLRSDLVEIVTGFYRRSSPAIILLPSNGMDRDKITSALEKILPACPRSTVVVKLSLDGPPEVHDALRGGAGSHAACLATARELGKLLGRYPNFELGVNSVFCPSTQETMLETVDFVASLPHIHTHTISLVRGELRERGQLDADLERYRQACEYLAGKLRGGQARTYRFGGGRLKAAQDILQRRYILQTAREGRALLPCYAGRLNLVVAHDGGVYPCEEFSPAMLMGNIRDFGGDLRPVLESSRAREVVDSIGAKGCHCTHECYMMTNILFNPTTYPALLKEYLRL